MRNLKLMEVLAQKGPACGTASLAMIIRFLTPHKTITPEDIDQEIRKLPGMFSAPADLIAYARSRGLKAEGYNNGSLQQLEALVSQGIPAMTLLDLTPDNTLDFDQWHWVVVIAIEGANKRKIITINNPWGEQEPWEQEKFLKEWAHLKLLGLTFGYNNYFIAVGTADDSLPQRRADGIGAADAITKGLADVLNGFATIRGDRNLAGVGRTLGGGFRLIFGALYVVMHNLYRQVKPKPKP